MTEVTRDVFVRPGDEAPMDDTEAAEARMREAGIATHELIIEDYFGFDETIDFVLPKRNPAAVDQVITHKVLTEGARKKYLKSIQKDVTIRKNTGDATMRMASGEERTELLKAAVVGWTLRTQAGLIPFTERKLVEWLDKADPKVVDAIHKDIMKHNTWLMQDLSVEDIDREIADLQELREQKVRDEEGKDAS